MQTIKLDDIANQLKQVAEQAHLSTNDIIEKFLIKYSSEANDSTLLTDIINELPEINAFNSDPVAIQSKLRHEWD